MNEAVMLQALETAFEAESKALRELQLPQYVFSEEFEKKMARLLRNDAEKRKNIRRFMVVSAAAASVALISVTVTAAPQFQLFMQNIFETHTDISVNSQQDSEHPNTIERMYYLSALPADYTLVNTHSADTYVIHEYESEQDMLTFSQTTYSSFTITVDNEKTITEMQADNSIQEYHVSEFNDGTLLIIWDNDDYIFTLTTTLDLEEALQLCRSLTAEN